MPEESPFPRSETRVRVLEAQERLRRLERADSMLQSVAVLGLFLGHLLDKPAVGIAIVSVWFLSNGVLSYQQSRAREEAEDARAEHADERLRAAEGPGLRILERSDFSNVDHFSRDSDGRVHIVAADFGDGSKVASVVRWLVGAGDEVKARDPIAEVLYDSWTLEFTAPIAGEVLEVLVQPSEEVALGSTLCVLNPGGLLAGGASLPRQ